MLFYSIFFFCWCVFHLIILYNQSDKSDDNNTGNGAKFRKLTQVGRLFPILKIWHNQGNIYCFFENFQWNSGHLLVFFFFFFQLGLDMKKLCFSSSNLIFVVPSVSLKKDKVCKQLFILLIMYMHHIWVFF